MSVGSKIAELRKKFNFTQEKLAEKIGVSRQTVANWEKDVTSPDLGQAILLSENLKVSLDELADNNTEITCRDNSDNRLLKRLIGKTCYLALKEEFEDPYLCYTVSVKVLDIRNDFMKIEYLNNKENCTRLIDIDLVSSIKAVKEEE